MTATGLLLTYPQAEGVSFFFLALWTITLQARKETFPPRAEVLLQTLA